MLYQLVYRYQQRAICSGNSCTIIFRGSLDSLNRNGKTQFKRATYKMHIKQIQDIQLQPGKANFDIKGCTINGDKVLFTDKGNRRIIVHDVTGRHVEDIPLSAEPFGITSIDDNMVAVTFGRKQYFEIINIDTKAVTKRTTDGNSWGITYENGNLYMIVDGHMHGINVAIMTSSGELFKMIPVSTDFDQTEYVAVNGDSIFFTVFIPKDIVCMDVNGAVQWQFQKNIFNQPRGVTTDTDGNIFVAGFSSHNVIAIQKSGSEGSEILDENEGLSYPTSIYCDKTNNRLLVSNLNNGHAYLFNIVYN